MRRRIIGALLLALVLALWPAGRGPSADAQLAYPAKPLVPAQSARAFGDSVGVNVRLHLSNSSYGDFPTVKDRLQELGVRHIGDGLCATCEHQIRHLQSLAALGISANIGVGNQNDSAVMQQNLQVIRSRLLRSVVAITGPNEPDISGDPDWIAHTRAYQADLYRRVKSDPALRHLPVIGPSLVYRPSRPALGDLSAHLDLANIHPYPAGVLPMADLALERQLAAHVSGSKPLVATEVGYHGDVAFTGIHRGASERARAAYTPRLVLEGFRQGLARTYLFQLADQWTPAQAQAWGVAGPSNAFGLLRWDLSRKPAFVALRNLLRAANTGSAPVASPGGLRYGLEGAGPDVRQLLLRSADGSYSLVLWRQVSVWDRDALGGPLSGAPAAGRGAGRAHRSGPAVRPRGLRRRAAALDRAAANPGGPRRARRWCSASHRRGRPRPRRPRPGCASTSRGRRSASGWASVS